MKNNKGFTIVELITSFALASIVMVFLFTIVMILKDNFISKSVRTDLVIKQSLLSKQINEDFKNNNIVSFSTCGKKCYEFELYDGTKKQLTISDAGDVIKYGDYTYELNNSSYAGKMNVFTIYNNVSESYLNDSILVIDLPIYNKKYPDMNFGVKAIYQYNSNLLENNLEQKLIKKISGDGTNVGDELAINNEHFYVISNDGNEAVLLSKYNLLVGNQCDSTGNNCVALTNPTGIQDATAKGWNYPNSIIGAVAFSSTNYWGSVSDGTYVYNNQASISNYVNNYKNYLESLGVEIKEAKLISKEELVSLGCNTSLSSSDCRSALTWVYSTSYWTGFDSHDDFIFHVDSDGIIRGTCYYHDEFNGVRPVIVIPASSI